MAVNMGNPSQWSFRVRGSHNIGIHVYPQIMSLTPSAQKWPHLTVQNSTRRVPLGFKNYSTFPMSIVAVHDQINGVANLPLEAIEDSPLANLVSNHSVPLLHKLHRQKYAIRSYDVGADKATPITTIFSLFQDAFSCYLDSLEITARDGFGATKAMHSLGLIWVVAKVHVEVESFPKWKDIIEIDSWSARAGKNGLRYEWLVRSYRTNEVLIRATSTWCMMDSMTRRVCKMPDAARAELDPYFVDDRFVFQGRDIELANRITRLDDLSAKYMTLALKCCRADLDANQHVTNSRYISWLLQSVPEEHMETHNLTSITIEYKRECRSKDCFESLTSAKKLLAVEGLASPGCEFTHLLHTEDSAHHEIARARTTWQPNPSCA